MIYYLLKDEARDKSAGVYRVLSKPFILETLQEMVDKAVQAAAITGNKEEI